MPNLTFRPFIFRPALPGRTLTAPLPMGLGLLVSALLACGACGGAPEVQGQADPTPADEGLEQGDPEIPQALELVLDVVGRRDDQGQLCIRIYDRAEAYADQGDDSIFGRCESGPGPYSFGPLLPGTQIAVAVIHDANGNEKLDTGIFGEPTEGYGFSKNPGLTLGAPAWEDVALTLNEDAEQSASIELIYLFD